MQHSLAEAQWFYRKVKVWLLLNVPKTKGTNFSAFVALAPSNYWHWNPPSQQVFSSLLQHVGALNIDQSRKRGHSGHAFYSLVGTPNLSVTYLTSISLIITEA